MKTWEVLGEDDYVTYMFSVDDVRKACVWFLGGHVERQDGWHASFPKEAVYQRMIERSWETLDEAKKSVEQDYEDRPW